MTASSLLGLAPKFHFGRQTSATRVPTHMTLSSSVSRNYFLENTKAEFIQKRWVVIYRMHYRNTMCWHHVCLN